MKTTKQLLKTIYLVAIVFVMAQACVPAGGGNPSPTNAFTVGINQSTPFSLNYTNEQYNIVKNITIDGDEISIKLISQNSDGGGTAYMFSRLYVNFPDSTYEVLYNNFDTSKVSDNILYGLKYGSYFWPLNSQVNNNQIPVGGTYMNVPKSTDYMLASHNDTWLLFYHNDFPVNIYKYIIFRKPKNGGYLYCWIKTIGIPDNILQPKRLAIKVENGRFQMNSIVTGQ